MRRPADCLAARSRPIARRRARHQLCEAAGGAEDLEATQAIQCGLASGANEVLTFGRHEGAIAHFHRELDAALAAL